MGVLGDPKTCNEKQKKQLISLAQKQIFNDSIKNVSRSLFALPDKQ